MTTSASLEERVADVAWYHTIELPGGITTPGYYDLRDIPQKLPFPDLKGKRCLDAASCDGFWAFTMARLGAEHVTSVDLPDPALQDWMGMRPSEAKRKDLGRSRTTFHLAREALDLEDVVERREMSVYDLSPDEVGTFDFVFMGNVLLHLQDPSGALRAIHSVTAGQFLSLECISVLLTVASPKFPLATLWRADEPRWWTPNMAGHMRLLRASGFRIKERGGPFIFQPFGDFFPKFKRPESLRDLMFWAGMRHIGAASSFALCDPIPDPG